jgi:hypothetical protein
MAREQKLPKWLQPTDRCALRWSGLGFRFQWDGFCMNATTENGHVALYSRNGHISATTIAPSPELCLHVPAVPAVPARASPNRPVLPDPEQRYTCQRPAGLH